MTVSRELSRYTLDLMQECRRSHGRAVALHHQERTHISMERGMRTMNWIQGSLYISESYQQLRGLSLLLIACHT
jgi:hypothetical protein